MIVRRARVRLTLTFMATFAAALAAFSIVFYVAIAVVLEPDFDIGPETTSTQAAQHAYDLAISRIGLALTAADMGAVLVVGAVAWALAGRTLDPIRDAHARQERFVADASHETRNPIAAIKATTESALSGDRSPDELREALVVIDAAVDRLTALTGDLLDLARARDPLAPSRREPADLSVLAAEVVEGFGPIASGATVRVELEPDLPILVDAKEVQRIIRNLVENAVRHGGGSVVVTTRRVDGDVACDVRDDGPGIPAAELSRIFEPFFRSSEARGREGAGLGLAIARDLAERNGGRVSAENAAGGGAVFRLVLPRRR